MVAQWIPLHCISFFLNELFFCCQSLNEIGDGKRQKEISSSHMIRVNLCIICRGWFLDCVLNKHKLNIKCHVGSLHQSALRERRVGKIHRQVKNAYRWMHNICTASPMSPASKCTFHRKEQRGTLSGNVSKPTPERDAERENTLCG